MGLPAGLAHIHFDSIDSTNAEAQRQAAKATSPIWFTADEQTAGKGRRGRAWSTAHGNFAGTLLLPIQDEPIETLAEYSFVAALALYDACVAMTGEAAAFQLKWPNDVLMRGAKLAGILLETIGSPSHLAIGIGVNLRHDPEAQKLEADAMQVASLNQDMTATEFLEHLAPAFEKYRDLRKAQGFQAIRTAWLEKAAKRGETLRARLPNTEITGIFVDLDDQGALILENARGRHVIAAGDVFF